MSVAELEERKAAEAERKAARERREAKAAAAAAAAAATTNDDAGRDGEAEAAEGDRTNGGGAPMNAPSIKSLEDQLREMMVKAASGGKLTGKEKRALAKAEKEGRLPSLEPDGDDDDDDGDDGASERKKTKKKKVAAFAMPESWARALDSVSVHVRGHGGDGTDGGKQARESCTTGAVVDVSGLDVSVRGVKIFEDAALRLLPGRRYALLGVNGSGKSTLVRLVASGRIRANVEDVACVAQELEGSDDASAFECLVACDVVAAKLLAEEAALIAEMEAAEQADDTSSAGNTSTWGEAEWASAAARLGELGDRLEQRGAHAAEAKARRILTGLGFDDAMQDAPLSTLSGGWRMRAALAQALFLEPGLLLLDEPTNHLDLPATLWLAQYLASPAAAKTTVLLVTHSADFVASTATDLLHLDHFQRAIVPHKGDVWNFLNGIESRYKTQCKEFDAQQKQLKELKSKGGLSGDKAVQKLLKTPGAKLLDKPKEYSVTFHFPSSGDDRSTIAVLDASYTIPGRSEPMYKNLRFSVHAKSRVALVGPNGCGKSTLLGLLTGRLTPSSGEVSPDRKLVVGRYDQHFEELLPLETNLSGTAHLVQTFGISEQDARKLLGRSGLESNAHLTPVKNLSGGQKSRVLFASLAATEADLLILDEPTNHLDLESVEALIEGLNTFEGGVVVSTHDARLVEGLEDVETWVCGEGETGVRLLPSPNGFERYRQAVAAEVEERVRRASAAQKRRRGGLRERAEGRGKKK